MVTLIKKKQLNNKGIVIFTHKEAEYFTYPKTVYKNNIFLNLFESFFKFIRRIYIQKYIYILKKNYFLGVHWGFYVDTLISPKWVDFHMGFNHIEKLNKHKNNCFFIPLTTRNFLPEFFKDDKTNKIYDFISISHSQKRKNIDKLFIDIRKVFDKGKNYTFLLLITADIDEGNKSRFFSYSKFLDNNFTLKEKKRIHIIKLHKAMGFLGSSQKFIVNLLNQSKIFIHYSSAEGESRVVHEALGCRLPLLIYKAKKSGATDYLNSSISEIFTDFNFSFQSMIDIYDNYDLFKKNLDMTNIDFLYEKNSIEKLKYYFDLLYKKNKFLFDYKLNVNSKLNMRLPSHEYNSNHNWHDKKKTFYEAQDIYPGTRRLKKFMIHANLKD